MKKYRVIQKGNGAIFGEFETRGQAAKEIMKYLNGLNDGGVVILSPFDFEEVECDVNEVITDFESARKALGIKPNDEFTVVRKEHSDIEFDDVASLVDDINPKHIEALMALNKLFTIAEAWNKGIDILKRKKVQTARRLADIIDDAMDADSPCDDRAKITRYASAVLLQKFLLSLDKPPVLKQ